MVEHQQKAKRKQTVEKALPPPVPPEIRVDRDHEVFEDPPPRATIDGFEDPIPLSALALETRDGGGNAMRRQRSNAWWGSLGIHTVALILFALLLAPASLGTATVQTLLVSLQSEVDEDPPPVLIESTVEQDTSLVVEQMEIPEPVAIPFTQEVQLANASNKKAGGSESKEGRSTGNTNAGSSGSFFGIQATGQSFVYVVDRSGSMNGRRYQRALDELSRSIDALTEDQKFLVVLFSSGKRVMFDTVDSQAEMIPASDENKSKLREWLYGVQAGGGTHPNAALRLALRQSPEAVFMLSDGAFNQESFNVPSQLLGGGGGPFEIATSNGAAIPIHSIAFEDPQSCKNMKRMASLTGGSYRFVSAGKSSEAIIKQAEDLLNSPDAAQRPNQLRHVLTELAPIVSDGDELRRYAQRVQAIFQERLTLHESPKSKLAVLNDELIALGRLDPDEQTLGDLDQEVRRQVSLEAERLAISKPLELSEAIRFVGELSESEVDPYVAEEVVGSIFDQEESTTSVLEAIEQSELLDEANGQKGSDIVRATLVRKYEQAFERRIDRYKERGQLDQALQTLRVHRDGTMRQTVEKMLRSNTFEILDRIRVEARAKNRAEANRLKAQLDAGFASDRGLLSNLRRDFAIDDRAASKLLTKVKRLPTGNQKTNGLRQILLRYPYSRSAVTAKQMLDRERQSTRKPPTSTTSNWRRPRDEFWTRS